jgi:hypothetical protein
MGEETLPREEVSQNLNAETSESQQSKPKKAIPGAPENTALSEPIAQQRNAVIDYDNSPTVKSPNAIAKNESSNDERLKRPLDAKIKVTEQSWREAEKQMNEKFKALDINLKVKVIIDLGGKPLERQQFQNRSGKETQKGFDPEFNVNDSYMVIDKESKLKDWQTSLINKEMVTPDEDWEPISGANLGLGVGISSWYQHLGAGNSETLQSYSKGFLRGKDIGQSLSTSHGYETTDEAQKGVSNFLAAVVEHEVGHTKFS